MLPADKVDLGRHCFSYGTLIAVSLLKRDFSFEDGSMLLRRVDREELAAKSCPVRLLRLRRVNFTMLRHRTQTTLVVDATPPLPMFFA